MVANDHPRHAGHRIGTGIGPAEFLAAVRGSNNDPIPATLRIEIRVELDSSRYLQCLASEIELRSRDYDRDRKLAGIGITGTATPRELEGLLIAVLSHYPLARGCELFYSANPQASRWEPPEFLVITTAATATATSPTAPEIDRIGIGAGAFSQVGDCRAWNILPPDAYCEAILQGRLALDRCQRAGR